MNKAFLLLNLENFDVLIEQTRTKPQETLEFKFDEPREIFSFNFPLNLEEEGRLVLRLTSLKVHNYIFKIFWKY